MDAAAFERLAEAAGGESRIPAYCNGTQPGDPKSKDEKQQPPGGQEQGQGGVPARQRWRPRAGPAAEHTIVQPLNRSVPTWQSGAASCVSELQLQDDGRYLWTQRLTLGSPKAPPGVLYRVYPLLSYRLFRDAIRERFTKASC
jgi:hypothetical protein